LIRLNSVFQFNPNSLFGEISFWSSFPTNILSRRDRSFI